MTNPLEKSVSRPRVAFIVPLLRGRGGWPTAMQGIVRSLAPHVEPVLVLAHADRAEAREIFPGIEAHVLPEIQPMVAGSWRVLAHMLPVLLALRSMPKLRIDLVHSLEMFPAGWVGDRLAAREGVPHVVTAFGTYGVIWRRWALAARIYRGVLRRAACLCPMSAGTAARMRSAFATAMADTPLEVVWQGSDFAARVPRAIAEHRNFSGPPVLLSVGGIKPRKGYRNCLCAFARLQREFPDAEYRIAGGGLGNTHHQELQTLIRREGIRNVRFLGALDWDQLDPHYREASLLAMVSQEEADRFEGFVFVFIEAGAYGLPVIGSQTGGITDAVRDGETGLLFDAEDVAGIAGGMIRLSQDAALSRTLGLAGRARAEELSWERYARQQMDVYRKILKNSNPVL
jgi:glycosyltransferase involved in cell wall biosynthesis